MELSDGVSTSDSTKIIPEENKNMDSKNKILLVFVVIANIIAIVALILAFVGVFNNGSNEYHFDSMGNPSSDTASSGSNGTPISDTASSGSNGNPSSDTPTSSDDKIWMFQIGHYIGNTQYLDEVSGTIKGFNVDVVNGVCQIANKNCRLVWDLYERCWDSEAGQRPRGGPGLMGGWYDACVGWAINRDRSRTYLFSKSFEKGLAPSYWVKPSGNTFSDHPDLTGKKVAILDGWSVDEHCLARYNVTGFDETDDQQVFHFTTQEDIVAALNASQVDIAFLPRVPYLDEHPEIKLAFLPPEDRCILGGPAMMMPMDQFELVTWFNAGFDRLKTTYVYDDICENLKIDHGDQPGNDPEYVCVD